MVLMIEGQIIDSMVEELKINVGIFIFVQYFGGSIRKFQELFYHYFIKNLSTMLGLK